MVHLVRYRKNAGDVVLFVQFARREKLFSGIFLQLDPRWGPRSIANLVYNLNNYGLWYL